MLKPARSTGDEQTELISGKSDNCSNPKSVALLSRVHILTRKDSDKFDTDSGIYISITQSDCSSEDELKKEQALDMDSSEKFLRKEMERSAAVSLNSGRKKEKGIVMSCLSNDKKVGDIKDDSRRSISDSPSRFSFFTKSANSSSMMEYERLSRVREVELKEIKANSKRSKSQSSKLKSDFEKSELHKSRLERIQASKLTKDTRQASKASITSLLFDTSGQYPKELMEQLNTELWGNQGEAGPSTSRSSSSNSTKFSDGSGSCRIPPHAPRKYVRMNTAPTLNLGCNSGNSSPKVNSDIRMPIKPINFTSDTLCTSEAFEQFVQQATSSNFYGVDTARLDKFVQKAESTSSVLKKKEGLQHTFSTSDISIKGKSSSNSGISSVRRENFELRLPQQIKNRQLNAAVSASLYQQSTNLRCSQLTEQSDNCYSTIEPLMSQNRTTSTPITTTAAGSSSEGEVPLKMRLPSSCTLGVQTKQSEYGSTLKPIHDYSDEESLSAYHTPAGTPPADQPGKDSKRLAEHSTVHGPSVEAAGKSTGQQTGKGRSCTFLFKDAAYRQAQLLVSRRASGSMEIYSSSYTLLLYHR